MRILVVADIHGNWPALAAIQETFDICLCLGDIVDYGPSPADCVRWVRSHATHAVRGNHDHGVAQRIKTIGTQGFRRLTALTRPLSWDTLTSEEIRYLGKLPLLKQVRIDGISICMVHATPRDPLDEYLFADEHPWRRRVESLEADLVLVGHSHHQFVLNLGQTTVVNPGSVGQPRDGDPRAGYAIIENGQIELKRITYPVEKTVELFSSLPLPEDAKQFSAEVWRTGGRRGDTENKAG